MLGLELVGVGMGLGGVGMVMGRWDGDGDENKNGTGWFVFWGILLMLVNVCVWKGWDCGWMADFVGWWRRVGME